MDLTKKQLVGLRKSSRDWALSLAEEYPFTSSELTSLIHAAHELDRINEARKIIRKEGLTVLDKFGCKKPHPAIQIEHDAISQYVVLCKALKLYTGESKRVVTDPLAVFSQ